MFLAITSLNNFSNQRLNNQHITESIKDGYFYGALIAGTQNRWFQDENGTQIIGTQFNVFVVECIICLK